MSHIHICNLHQDIQRDWPCDKPNCDLFKFKLCDLHNPGQIGMNWFDLRREGGPSANYRWYALDLGQQHYYTQAMLTNIMGRWGVLQYELGQKSPDGENQSLVALMPDGFWRHGTLYFPEASDVAMLLAPEAPASIFLDEDELIAALSAQEAEEKYGASLLAGMIEHTFSALCEILSQATDNKWLRPYILESFAGSTVQGAFTAYKRNAPKLVWARADVYGDENSGLQSEPTL